MSDKDKPAGPGDEWDNEFEGGGDATTIDPEALAKLRSSESLKAVSPSDDSLDGAAEEFGDASATVMEDVEELPASSLLQAVDSVDGDEHADFDDHSVTRMDPQAMSNLATAEGAIGKKTCPGCGVMVSPGYPKCPRCKRSLVVKSSGGKYKAGGTSVVGRTVPWAIVLVAAVLTAIIVYLAERDPVVESNPDEIKETRGDDEAEPEAAEPEAEAAEPEAAEPDTE